MLYGAANELIQVCLFMLGSKYQSTSLLCYMCEKFGLFSNMQLIESRRLYFIFALLEPLGNQEGGLNPWLLYFVNLL